MSDEFTKTTKELAGINTQLGELNLTMSEVLEELKKISQYLLTLSMKR